LLSRSRSRKTGERSRNPEAANHADIIAIPHPAVPDGHAVRKRIGVLKLDFFEYLACLRVVFEEGVEVRVGNPQIPAFPANTVRAIARGRELCPHDPGLRIDAIDFA